MMSNIKYGRVGKKHREVMIQENDKKRTSEELYAIDCATFAFYDSKRDMTNSSDASAKEAKSKANADRLSAKEVQELKNKTFLENRWEQKV